MINLVILKFNNIIPLFDIVRKLTQSYKRQKIWNKIILQKSVVWNKTFSLNENCTYIILYEYTHKIITK